MLKQEALQRLNEIKYLAAPRENLMVHCRKFYFRASQHGFWG